jgi:flagellar motor switch protein FliN/FliY
MNETANAENTDQKETTTANSPPNPDETYDMDLILDIPLEVSVELGQVKMIVNDLLQLGQGSIIELGKPVGESLEIFVNNKLIARGEVVVVDEKLGVRVTDIISPMERVKSLG